MNAIPLNLIPYREKVRQREYNGTTQLFCVVRKKWIRAQPEEWVRQLLLQHLCLSLGWPLGHMAVEKSAGPNLRWDIATYDDHGTLTSIIECKRPEHKIQWKDLFQQLSYNQSSPASLLLLTNGLFAIAHRWNEETQTYDQSAFIPHWEELKPIKIQ